MQEVWKSIEGYEEKYEISNLGRVKSLVDKNGHFREKILKPRLSKNGYLYLNLWKDSKSNTKKIHRLVAEAFCEREEKDRCVNHINGVKTDNRAVNLEWCTVSYNIKEAYRIGLITPTNGERNGMYGVHGKDHPSSKPVNQYGRNGQFIKRYESCVEAGIELNLGHGNIQKCARGDRKTAYGYIWKYVEDEK